MGRYTDEAIALTRSHGEQLGRIATHRDPHLTPDGLAARRRDAEKALRAATAAELAGLRSRARQAALSARSLADTARPRIGNDPSALIRAEQKWHQVEGLLKAGRDLHDVVRSADIDTLLAIEEWAPSYLAAQSVPDKGLDTVLKSKLAGGARPDVTRVDVTNIINGRLAELVTADVAYKLRDAAEQEADLRKAEPYLTRAERLSEGSDVEGGAIGTAIASAAA